MNELIMALNSEDETERLYAAHDIAETNDPKSASALVDRLGNESSQLVKDAIVFALKTIQCSLIYDQLFLLFSSPEAYLRNQAVAIFGTEENNAVPFLTSKLDHANHEVRKLILDSLFEIGTRDAVLAIRAYIHDKAENVRIAAVEYLGRLNDTESISELIELFKNDTGAMLRSSVLDTLAIIGNEQAIKTVVGIIQPMTGITMVEPPLYVPQLIDLVCKSGCREDVIAVLKTVGNRVTLADDIVAGLLIALRKYNDLLTDKSITDSMISFLLNNEVRDEIRLNVADILSNSSFANTIEKEEAFEIGNRLIQESSMIVGGLKLLKASGTKDAIKKIHQIIDKADNEDLKVIYEDLLNDKTIQENTPGSPLKQ